MLDRALSFVFDAAIFVVVCALLCRAVWYILFGDE